ncbi:type IV secretion system protein [Nocardioides terrisoli]|uniref:type IV secretion system protein n=1 Tax=Nocardioides terrisoli TaxID=3388267 RepID=UPI00287BBCFC|nr:type IV secretion system protein [Nocardioides marmorisolisilvae]
MHSIQAFDPTVAPPFTGCPWWNLICKGGHQVADAGLSAITRSIATGAKTLLSQIVKNVDQSSTVPLADPTYRHVYYGFLGLAASLIGVVLCIALVMACLRRDPGTLGRAAVGVGVASLGGGFYIVMAQLLIALDDWLSHSVVRITGYDLSSSIDKLASGFDRIAGDPGQAAANMLLILLMAIMLVSGLILWFVLALRKVAILVVVAFAPLLIAGYLWAPTRAWVRKTTEVLIALVFTKTAIFTLFGVGLALLARGTDQSLSDFVGETVLMCGACFAPLVMLRLVHFAADTHLAGDAMGTLRGGMNPVLNRMPGGGSGSGMRRKDAARAQSTAPRPEGPEPAMATNLPAPGGGGEGVAAGASGEGAGGMAASGGAATAAGVAGVATLVAAETTKAAGTHARETSEQLADHVDPGRTAQPPRDDAALPGPDADPSGHGGQGDKS